MEIDKTCCPMLVMCGGRGTRLKELGQNIPKALVELDGSPLLFHKFRHGLSQGFREFILAVGYKAEMIVDAAKNFGEDTVMRYSDSGLEAGMLRRIYDAREYFSKRAIVTYGDSLSNIDYHELLRFHLEKKGLITIVSAPIQSPFGMVTSNTDGRVMSMEEKPVLHYYIGTFILEREALDYIPETVIDWADGQGLIAFFKILMAINRLYTYIHQGPDITFNTIEELGQAKESYLKFYTHFNNPTK